LVYLCVSVVGIFHTKIKKWSVGNILKNKKVIIVETYF